MTDKQPEALRLADALIKHLGGNTATQAAAELRRLHDLSETRADVIDHMADRIAALEQAGRQALDALEAGDEVDAIFAGETITALREALGDKHD